MHVPDSSDTPARGPLQERFDFSGGNPAQRGQSFLVTGGTGFIGQTLVSALLNDGHQVTLWTRSPRKAAKWFGQRVACVTSLMELDPARHIDVVINLAGAPILGPRWTRARKRDLIDSRVLTTEKLVTWLTLTPRRPRLLISGSAVGYYGIQADDDPRARTETDNSQATFASRLCRQWEDAAHAAQELGITVVVVRLGVVYGHARALPAMLLPVRLGLGGRMGSGHQAQSWIHIADVIGAIAWLCGRPTVPASPCYNLVAPECPTQLHVVRTAAALLHRPTVWPTPAWVMRLLLGEQATLLLDGMCAAPRRLLEEGYVFRYPTLNQALRQLLGHEA